jgi:hypothetical protein
MLGAQKRRPEGRRNDFIKTRQYEKANQDLIRAEELNPGAPTLKVARSIYLDAVDPVKPQIEIDDSRATDQVDRQQR